MNDEVNLIAELKLLDRRPDLGRLAAHVALVRGAHLLCDSGRQADGRNAVRLALIARSDLLSEADALFAEALVETRARPMIEALRKAIGRDALHYPARACLVVALLASGQPDEALIQADQMAALFPDSAVPPFIRAVVAVLYGDRKAMHAGLDATADRLKVDPAPFRQYLNTFADILDIMAEAEDGPSIVGLGTQARLFFLVPQLEARAVAAGKPLAFAVPSINLMFLWCREVFATARDASPNSDRGLQRLVELGRDSPEALIHSLIAAHRMATACGLVNANRLHEARDVMAEFADLAYVAADAPTLLVRSPIRYQTRFIAMFADVGVMKLDPADDRKRVQRLRDNLHRLVADGRRWRGSRRQCIPFLARMITSSLTPELAANWRLDTSSGTEAFQRRNRWLSQIGRTLIEDWLDDEPENRDAVRLLDVLEKWAEPFEVPKAPVEGKPRRT